MKGLKFGYIHCKGCGDIYLHPVEKQLHIADESEMSITFWCENCHVLTQLTISSHEGVSMLDISKAKNGFDLDKRKNV